MSDEGRGRRCMKHLWSRATPVIRAALLLAICSACAPQARAAEFAQPQGWVNDYAGVYTAPQRGTLESLCSDLERNTTAELAIVTVQSLGGESIESYSKRLFNSWGIGKRGQNNGVLLLFAMKDRRVRIAVGDGLTSVLPEAACQSIIDGSIVPAFKAGIWVTGDRLHRPRAFERRQSRHHSQVGWCRRANPCPG